MAELVKRYVAKDGNTRINFYCDEYAENPRNNTDEPLHFEDWARDYSLMNKDERNTRSGDASALLKFFIRDYGDHKKILDLLFDNGKHMHDGKCNGSDALVYDRNYKKWRLYSYMYHYNYQKRENELGWYDIITLPCKKSEIYLDDELIDALEDDTIDYVIEHCMTDGIKLGSYSFGYNGEVFFSDGADTNSIGICWLEKNEFLKYSGISEEDWKSKTFKDIDWLCDEIEAWGNGDVYGFVTETAVKSVVSTHYPDGEHEDSEDEHIEWEESESCWGFYGEVDKVEADMFDCAGLKKEDFEEEEID